LSSEFKTWLGAESNRRHVDFQSTALPTELPSLANTALSCPCGISGLLTKAENVQRSTFVPPHRAAQVETESCKIPHHVHRIEFRQIIRDAEIAYAISPVVRRHRLTEEETEKFLVELRIPRAANVAGITHRLVVNCSQKASSELATQS
jgi:hypothetical protein